ncbi:oxysterol-binding protein-related protein 1-like isoform X2 [Oratosquilla oratoria]|uniref:oxysterol-binding protein-related protein 1-like isoform X2 n=1 Tax=Oratosquilla oratoria TaxID=337810 RepID=UPI003F7653E7
MVTTKLSLSFCKHGMKAKLHLMSTVKDVVLLLLENGASVSVINGEGLKPSDMPRKTRIMQLILAAEKTERRRGEERLLHAAREGNSEDVMKLLRDPGAPNINCSDCHGNTSLHCAAYRGHIDVAVCLLQNGCDPAIKNNKGQTACELAQTPQMQQVLEVPPVRSFQKSVTRFEGQLLRRMRFIGWKVFWAVLERGVLTFFNKRADACSGVNRRDYKYMDGAKVVPAPGDSAMFVVHYNDGTCHRLSATPDHQRASINRQKWVAALGSHIRFASHYVQQGLSFDTDDDDDIESRHVKPLGCMQDALQNASAHEQLLEQQLQELMALVAAQDLDESKQGSLYNILKKFSLISNTARNMTSSLSHCLTLFKQQEEVRDLQLKEEKEKVRVLEESLRVLATEHHELEESIASHVSSSYNTPANSYVSLPRPRRFFDTSDDEFFDAFSQDDDSRTLVSIPSPSESECSTNTLVSCMSSLPTDPQSPQQHQSVQSTAHPNSPNDPIQLPHENYPSLCGTYTMSPRTGSTTTVGTSIDYTMGPSPNSGTSGTSGTSPPGGTYTISPVPPATRTIELSPPTTPTPTDDGMGESEGTDGRKSQPDSEAEERSSLTLISLGGTRYFSPYVGPQRCWRSWGRTSLPAPQFQRNDFSLWSVLKQCIGKELSKITMPVVFNEPLSFLERMTEYMEYAWLLDKADQAQDPIVRMQYICAFAVSGLASNWERLGKPFNPLLGETYELQRDNYRIICEQVSHHPPVSAFHSESQSWIFHGSIHPKLKFWGKSVEIQPKGCLTIELPSHGEAYTWTNVNCCVHNIIVGKLWIEQYGTMEIVSHTTGLKCVLTFKTAGWFSKDLHRVEGFIIDKNKKKHSFLYGKWTEFLRATDINSYDEYIKTNAHKFRRDDKKKSSDDSVVGTGASPAHNPRKMFSRFNTITQSFKMGGDSEATIECEEGPEEPEEGGYPRTDSTYSIDIPNSNTLWEADPRPDNSAQFYHFTLFAMSLNEQNEDMKRSLSCTDCRLRPDIRLLEAGDIDGAAAEKSRLEEKQRDARKSRKKSRIDWKARWFEQGTNPFTRLEDWLYSGGYWDRNYDQTIDIF